MQKNEVKLIRSIEFVNTRPWNNKEIEIVPSASSAFLPDVAVLDRLSVSFIVCLLGWQIRYPVQLPELKASVYVQSCQVLFRETILLVPPLM